MVVHHLPVWLFRKSKEVPLKILIGGSKFKFIMLASNFQILYEDSSNYYVHNIVTDYSDCKFRGHLVKAGMRNPFSGCKLLIDTLVENLVPGRNSEHKEMSYRKQYSNCPLIKHLGSFVSLDKTQDHYFGH